jgi:type IV pilus assembly protein PilO
MTNLQEAANPQQLRWRRRILFGLPIAVGGLLATAITALFTVPQWLGLQASSARYQQLEALRQQLPLLRDQLAKSGQEIERNARRQRNLLRLIEGSGELSTFLAQLDLEASRHGVQLELFEPTTLAGGSPAAAEQPARGRANAPAPEAVPAAAPQDPLEAAGLEGQRVLLSARGRYPNLLAYMRSVEQLSLLVVPSDFALELVDVPREVTAAPVAADAPKPRIPEMKLSLAYYRAPAGGLKPPAPPAAGQQSPPGSKPAGADPAN